MLTSQEYESFKKRLKEAEKKLVSIEARKTQIIEQLKEQYQMTPEEAKDEMRRLSELLPQKEAEFAQLYNDFMATWGDMGEKE